MKKTKKIKKETKRFAEVMIRKHPHEVRSIMHTVNTILVTSAALLEEVQTIVLPYGDDVKEIGTIAAKLRKLATRVSEMRG